MEYTMNNIYDNQIDSLFEVPRIQSRYLSQTRRPFGLTTKDTSGPNKELGEFVWKYTIWLFNIAMENHHVQ
jgi:hypothetical protein